MRARPDEALELLLLDGLPGVGPVTVRALVTRFGSASAALVAPNRDFAGVAGTEAARSRSDPDRRREVARALAGARAAGVEVVTWTGDGYPTALRHLTDPPPVLFLMGRRDLLGRPAVTVVGARRATERARDVAARLGAALARAEVVVVSGMALGVDGAAHAGALRAGGDTIAVLGTGPDVVYPRAHRALYASIGERGLVVSEFLPGTVAAPHNFPRRNRILAAVSATTVVVEAGARSGSLITVDHALDLGRDVWAVPGPIERTYCHGSNRLLADGARPLVDIDHFVAQVTGRASAGTGSPGTSASPSREAVDSAAPPSVAMEERSGANGPESAASPTSTLEDRVLAVLAEGALNADDVAELCDLPVQTTLAVLTTLELHGEVERIPGLRFRRAA